MDTRQIIGIIFFFLIIISLLLKIRTVRKEHKEFYKIINLNNVKTLTIYYRIKNGDIRVKRYKEFEKFSDNREDKVKEELAKKWNCSKDEIKIEFISRN